MYQKYIDYLKETLDDYRFNHSLNVADMCKKLASKNNYDEEKAYLCGLLHDVCKNDSNEKMLQIFHKFDIILDDVQKNVRLLWHSIAGSAFIQDKFSIKDKEIIDAIRYHTTGRENMTKLDKILFLADFISADRNFDGVDRLREIAENNDLDTAIFECLKFSIDELITNQKPIHIDTINAYNYMCLERM